MDEISESILNGQYKQAVAQIREYGYELKEVYKYLQSEGYCTYSVAVLADMMIEWEKSNYANS